VTINNVWNVFFQTGCTYKTKPLKTASQLVLALIHYHPKIYIKILMHMQFNE